VLGGQHDQERRERQRVERYRHADQDQVEDHGRVSGLIEAEVALMLDTR